MRRRSKRGPNNSESTGKSGQELPQNQPAPLQPNYADAGYQPKPGKPSAASAEGRSSDPKDQPSRGNREPQRQRGREQRPATIPVIGSDLEHAGRVSNASADGGPWEPEDGDDVIADDEPTAAHEEQPGPDHRSNVPPAAAESPAAEGKLVVETQPESPSLPPPEAVGSPRPSRGFVVLTIGLPGSGKTTWFKRRGVTPLSSDMLRSILFDDIGEQRYQGLVFSTLRSLLRARLIAKMPWNYVDATNLSPHERRQWIKMAKSFGYDVQAVFFDVPFAVCMERNRRRERTLSDEAMQRMAERLRPPSFKEGFSKITLVRVKGQPAPTPESAMSAPVPMDTSAELAADLSTEEGVGETSGYLEGEEV